MVMQTDPRDNLRCRHRKLSRGSVCITMAQLHINRDAELQTWSRIEIMISNYK